MRQGNGSERGTHLQKFCVHYIILPAGVAACRISWKLWISTLCWPQKCALLHVDLPLQDCSLDWAALCIVLPVWLNLWGIARICQKLSILLKLKLWGLKKLILFNISDALSWGRATCIVARKLKLMHDSMHTTSCGIVNFGARARAWVIANIYFPSCWWKSLSLAPLFFSLSFLKCFA